MSTEGQKPNEIAKEAPKTDATPALQVKAEKPAAKPAAKKEKVTEEPDRFADVRDLAAKNHKADLARTAKLASEDESAKTELEAQPDKTESKNPEQVKVSSKFPEAK